MKVRKENIPSLINKYSDTYLLYVYLDLFKHPAFDQFMSTPLDPFDVLNDIQFFQESDFTSKMMNSPSYRNLYTHLFKKMNNNSQNNRHIYSSSPIFLNNDRLFRPTSNNRSTNHPQQYNLPSTNPIPVIHSMMANDFFLNELIDLCEQQNIVNIPSSHAPFMNNNFFDDLTHCTQCHKKISSDRTRLIQHEQQCRQKANRYANIPSKSVRV